MAKSNNITSIRSYRDLLAYSSAYAGLQAVLATLATFIPPFAEWRLHATPHRIGLLLALPPLIGLVVQPVGASFSDSTTSRWGRRLPWMAAAFPVLVASLILTGAAHTWTTVLLSLVAVGVGFHLFEGTYRASLGEEAAASQQTLVSGIQGLMKGVGTLVAFLVGTWLWQSSPGGPFWAAALLVVVTAIPTFRSFHFREPPERAICIHPLRTAWADVRRSPALDLVLAANFLSWFALHAAFSFTVLFVVHELVGIGDLSSEAGRRATQDAVVVLAIFAVVGMLAAVPMGQMATRWGLFPVLFFGMVILCLGLLAAACSSSLPQAYVFAVLCGVGFSAVQVIPFPLALALFPREHTGALTGIFNFLIYLPQVLAAPFCGWFIEILGSYRVVYWVGAVMVSLSLVLLSIAWRRGGLPAGKRGKP